ncbi:MAG: N-acetylmuramoyl-L-alanine amidase [Opitutaceae bacterium]|nr:N-acetylmuramoyl-L-alanine amidase [Opitutaceae bacterium]
MPTAPPPPALSAATTRKFGGREYVSAGEVASRLRLQLSWISRGRRLVLTGPAVKAELENDTRDVTINGLRVFLGDPVVDAGGELYVSRVDFERCLTPLLRPGHGVPPHPPLKTIVLDPGHGGRDHGTSALEKTYTLDVARRARKLLEAAGFKVVLTRDADVYLDLQERSAIANASRAGLFVSIHFNAIGNDRKTSGVEVFTFAPQFQRSTNAWSPGSGNDTEKDPAPVNRHDHWSVVLAQSLHRRFVYDLKAFDRGRKIAHWGVLRGLNCPGVLVECGFLTSTEEARKIATPQYRERLAVALANGIREYAATTGSANTKSAAASARPAGSARRAH